MLDRNDLVFIEKIIDRKTRYMRHYTGKVVDVTDPAPTKKGRVKVVISDLSLDKTDATYIKGMWCWPRDKNSMSLPKVGQWVEVYFRGGDPDKPVYLGTANEINDMTPKGFDGVATTHVLFEDPADTLRMIFDGLKNQLNVGKTSLKAAARKDDPTFSDNGLDSAFWGFVGDLKTYLDTTVKTFLNSHTHQAGTLLAPNGAVTGVTGAAVSPFSGAYPTSPTSLTGKVKEGSDQVFIGGQ